MTNALARSLAARAGLPAGRLPEEPQSAEAGSSLCTRLSPPDPQRRRDAWLTPWRAPLQHVQDCQQAGCQKSLGAQQHPCRAPSQPEQAHWQLGDHRSLLGWRQVPALGCRVPAL